MKYKLIKLKTTYFWRFKKFEKFEYFQTFKILN